MPVKSSCLPISSDKQTFILRPPSKNRSLHKKPTLDIVDSQPSLLHHPNNTHLPISNKLSFSQSKFISLSRKKHANKFARPRKYQLRLQVIFRGMPISLRQRDPHHLLTAKKSRLKTSTQLQDVYATRNSFVQQHLDLYCKLRVRWTESKRRLDGRSR